MQLLRRLCFTSKENGQPTLTSVPLFGKDMEQRNMTASFRLGHCVSSQANLIIQVSIEHLLIEMPDKVMETLRSKYLVSPIPYEGSFRKEFLEIEISGEGL